MLDIRNKRAQIKEHNRRAILDAARGVFGCHGYRAATVRDIIGATPLAAGTFYNYFKSKEDVYAALRDEAADELRPLLRAEREQAQTADEFIHRTFRAFLTHAAQRSQSFAIIDASEKDAAAGARMIVMGGEDLRRDLRAAIDNGVLGDVDEELLTAAIVGVAFEAANVMRGREHPDPVGAAWFCSELILRGLSSREVAGTPRPDALV
jgi:AcrR family transcriptional regulator